MMDYISATIEACGGIIAAILGALIAGGYISKIFKSDVLPQFHTYSNKSHNAHKIMRKAEENIYFVISIGDRLLKKHEEQMRMYLKKGVKLNFLIHAEAQYYELEKYINAPSKFDINFYQEIRKETLEKLWQLEQGFPKLVEIREFHSFFSASYIAIDIEEDVATNRWPPHSIIQMMLYQYGVTAEGSPITYFSPKSNYPLFHSTAKCILDMWESAKRFPSINHMD